MGYRLTLDGIEILEQSSGHAHSEATLPAAYCTNAALTVVTATRTDHVFDGTMWYW